MDSQNLVILWLDDVGYNGRELIDAIRSEKLLPTIVRELIVKHAIRDISCEAMETEKAMRNFRREKKLETEESLRKYLEENYIDKEFLNNELCKKIKINKFKEERWGPRITTLYLKNKEDFDSITYKCLEAANGNIMKEVYFRLKDGEENWESLAKQFKRSHKDLPGACYGPVESKNLEKPLVDALRKAGPGKIIGPIQLKGSVAVAELVKIEATPINEHVRKDIIQKEYDKWLMQESKKVLSNLSFAS